MGDPRFERTVILIVEHGPSGAMGLVINKPVGERPLASVLEALGQKDGDVTGNVRVFAGGPVRPEVGFVVHSSDYRRPETVAITDHLSITSSIAILQDIGAKRGPAKVLVTFGYAGWGPDQLEHEIEEHAWGTVRPTRPSSSTRTGTMFGMSPGSVEPSMVTWNFQKSAMKEADCSKYLVVLDGSSLFGMGSGAFLRRARQVNKRSGRFSSSRPIDLGCSSSSTARSL